MEPVGTSRILRFSFRAARTSFIKSVDSGFFVQLAYQATLSLITYHLVYRYRNGACEGNTLLSCCQMWPSQSGWHHLNKAHRMLFQRSAHESNSGYILVKNFIFIGASRKGIFINYMIFMFFIILALHLLYQSKKIRRVNNEIKIRECG